MHLPMNPHGLYLKFRIKYKKRIDFTTKIVGITDLSVMSTSGFLGYQIYETLVVKTIRMNGPMRRAAVAASLFKNQQLLHCTATCNLQPLKLRVVQSQESGSKTKVMFRTEIGNSIPAKDFWTPPAQSYQKIFGIKNVQIYFFNFK